MKEFQGEMLVPPHIGMRLVCRAAGETVAPSPHVFHRADLAIQSIVMALMRRRRAGDIAAETSRGARDFTSTPDSLIVA
jgi:hypothetical protein